MELYVIISDDPQCHNPMGIYDTFELARIYCDKLYDTESILARVCRYFLNEHAKCNGHTMFRVYENGIPDEEREDALVNHLISLMK